jgi:hypothetical protein
VTYWPDASAVYTGTYDTTEVGGAREADFMSVSLCGPRRATSTPREWQTLKQLPRRPPARPWSPLRPPSKPPGR